MFLWLRLPVVRILVVGPKIEDRSKGTKASIAHPAPFASVNGMRAEWVRPPHLLWLWWTLATFGALLLVTALWVAVGYILPARADDFLVIMSPSWGPVPWQVLRTTVIWWLPLSLAQWAVLRRYVRRGIWWVPATLVGHGVGLGLVVAHPVHTVMRLLPEAEPFASLGTPLEQALAGAVSGSVQWLVLRPLFPAGWQWVVVNALAWGAAAALHLLVLMATDWINPPMVGALQQRWTLNSIWFRVYEATVAALVACAQGVWLARVAHSSQD